MKFSVLTFGVFAVITNVHVRVAKTITSCTFLTHTLYMLNPHTVTAESAVTHAKFGENHPTDNTDMK